MRRISLIRNSPGRGEVAGMFFTYRGIALLAVLAAVTAFASAGYLYGRAAQRASRAESMLETRRRMHASLQARYDGLMAQLAGSQATRTVRKAAVTSDPQSASRARLYSSALDEFALGNFAGCISALSTLLKDPKTPAALRRDAFLKAAFCCVFTRRSDRALSWVENALGEFPHHYPFLQLKANLLLEAGDFETAAPVIERLFGTYAGPGTLLSRGNVRWGLGRFSDAAADLKEVLSCGSPLLEKAAANNLALLYSEGLGDRPNALLYLEMLKNLAPAGVMTAATAGRVHLALENHKEALDALLTACARSPRDAQLLLEVSRLYAATGRDSLSKEYLEQALSIDENSRRKAHRLRGAWVFILAGVAPPARSAASQSTADAAPPDDSPGHQARLQLLKANALVQSGRSAQAAKALQKALSLAPKDTEVLLFAASYANATGDTAAATIFYLSVLEHDRRQIGALRGLAATLLARGKFDRAAQWADKGLDAAGGDVVLLAVSAKAHFARCDHRTALERIRSYEKSGGAETSSVAYMAASCLENLRAPRKDIRASYEKALALDPENIPATNDYVAFLAREGLSTEALALAGELLRISRRASFALDTAGCAHLSAGDPDAARRLFDEALAKESTHPEILLHAALAYRKLGDAKKGESLYEAALEHALGNETLLQYIKEEFARG